MSEPPAFERVLALLYDAMLDETHWPATSALMDETCGGVGNVLLVAEGPPDDIRVLFVGLYSRGQRRTDLEREHLEFYHPIDERVPRVRRPRWAVRLAASFFFFSNAEHFLDTTNPVSD